MPTFNKKMVRARAGRFKKVRVGGVGPRSTDCCGEGCGECRAPRSMPRAKIKTLKK